MTMSVDNIIKMLCSSNQLKYRRLHFADFARELAPRPATVSVRVTLPSFFRSLLDDSANVLVQSVSGKKFSFWHSFLYCVYPGYITMSWYDRKELVDRFIDELDHDIWEHDSRSEIGLRDLIASDQLIAYLCSKFQINIIVCDSIRIHFTGPSGGLDRDMPSIMLFCDDSPVYHVITVDDIKVFRPDIDAHIISRLYQTAPAAPVAPAPVAPVAPILSSTDIAMLNQMRIDELQVLASKFNVPTFTVKTVKKLKKELVADIIAALTH